MIEINDENFDEVVTNASLPVLIDFWAPWCGPCRMVSPVVDELAEEYEGQWIIAKCNVDEADEIPVKFGIRSIPTLLFFRGGVLKDKMVGASSKSLILEKMKTI